MLQTAFEGAFKRSVVTFTCSPCSPIICQFRQQGRGHKHATGIGEIRGETKAEAGLKQPVAEERKKKLHNV